MTIVLDRFTNHAFGFPTRGHARRVDPIALACVHITGNNRTGKMDEEKPGSGARAEWHFANRADSGGPSAHLYVARDGSGIEAIDPGRFAAWSNGDLMEPNTDNAGVARLQRLRAKGYNVNEAYWEEIECVGGSQFPLTEAQLETVARRIAERAGITGLPISRATVHGHWEINGINRQNCPAPKSSHADVLQRIVKRAQEIASEGPGADRTPAAMAPVAGKANPQGQPAAGQTVFRFGGEPRNRGEYSVVVDVARQRSTPFIASDNLVGRVRRGVHFHVHQTTDTGGVAGGSPRWFGNGDGTVWMHSSVIRPIK